MLERIRAALADVPETENPAAIAVPRDYLRHLDLDLAERLELFRERIEDYKVLFKRIPRALLSQHIKHACEARNAKSLVIPKDLPEAWLPEGLVFIKDENLSYEALDESDGVITGCELAVAQTGSIALAAGRYQGRRALSLVPDYHLCIVFAEQVLDLLPEAFSKLEPSLKAGKPITFISGPSATSDIELNRVEGVHGPRTLEVLVVLDES